MINLYDKELEQIVLGQILAMDECYARIADIFFPELFYDHRHEVIANAIETLKNTGSEVDIATVTSWLNKNGKLTDSLTAFYITSLTQNVGGTGHLVSHIRFLQELYMKRKIIVSCEQTIKETTDAGADVFEIIDGYERRLTKLTSKLLVDEPKSSTQVYMEMVKYNEEILKRKGFSGVPSGFVSIDSITGGWQKSDLIILAARPGMGKTAFALSCLKNPAVMYGTPTLIFSLEMSRRQLYARLKASESEIDLSRFLREGLNEMESKVVNQTCAGIAKAPMYFEDRGGLTVFEIKNIARKMKRDKNIQLIVIDYLQLISAGIKTNSRENEIGYISRSLKSLAKELDIPIIALSQLSRDVEKRDGKIPGLSDLRDSGSIEQDADIVMFIYRPEYYGIMQDSNGNSTTGKAMIMIEKHRNGGLDHVPLNFIGRLTKFTD